MFLFVLFDCLPPTPQTAHLLSILRVAGPKFEMYLLHQFRNSTQKSRITPSSNPRA
jgi:hypothetical protein